MTEKSKIQFLSPVKRRESEPKATLLSREHDTNDTIKERLAFVEQINSYVKQKEDNAVQKAMQKAQEGQQKASAGLFNMFVWMNIYGVIMIIILKALKVI